tara:strand:- start:1171 stop:1599 length:429 start_codon:yes stop_codon:yes gene_type:complete
MIKHILSILILLGLLACSSNGVVIEFEPTKGILEIDELVSAERTLYFDDCYGLFLDAGVPETECQSDLFGIIDRRHGTRFNKKQLANVADEYFFHNLLQKKLITLIRSNSGVRDQVRAKFDSMESLTSYYKGHYSFHKYNQY